MSEVLLPSSGQSGPSEIRPLQIDTSHVTAHAQTRRQKKTEDSTTIQLCGLLEHTACRLFQAIYYEHLSICTPGLELAIGDSIGDSSTTHYHERRQNSHEETVNHTAEKQNSIYGVKALNAKIED